ncbi:RNA polymerase factor sigma-54 [Psychrobacillus sp. NPDC096426]|uniref:RNA polymerase factor sigma-54 n=1 Tax=Psychrobacillus sp. NPDC096426 TaxID=3364491 RepID=UPI0038175254
MNLNMQVTTQLTQTLTIDLIQHLEILQFSDYELEKHIYEKSIENPLLNVIEPELKHMKNIVDLSTIQRNNPTMAKNPDPHFDRIQTALPQKEPIEKYLLEQIPLDKNLSKTEIRIVKYLIHHLDERYFLCEDIFEIANQLNEEVELVELMLGLLQTFEPFGVGARNLQEYLLIQIDNDVNALPLAGTFVKHNLSEVADLSIKLLSRTYKASIREVKETIYYIRSLNPPSINEPSVGTSYIIPDVYVKNVYNEWIIELNTHSRPQIEINEVYVDLLKTNPDYKNYYQNCLKDIMLLIQGIEQRDKTIYRLTRLLLELQPSFFKHGMRALTPMRLKDVADALELHESTVSRAVRGKYIHTPIGIFSFRSLFTKGLTNSFGKTDSVSQIKQRIQEMVAKEIKDSPLSDQQLTEELLRKGVQISRRTVTKYRKELNIPNSNKRVLYQLDQNSSKRSKTKNY